MLIFLWNKIFYLHAWKTPSDRLVSIFSSALFLLYASYSPLSVNILWHFSSFWVSIFICWLVKAFDEVNCWSFISLAKNRYSLFLIFRTFCVLFLTYGLFYSLKFKACVQRESKYHKFERWPNRGVYGTTKNTIHVNLIWNMTLQNYIDYG